jgi:hypothetical protein
MSMNMRFPLGLLVLAMLGTGSLVGCAGGSNQRGSEVAQGQRFRSGNADYDRFFDVTHALQVQMAAAPGELADARQHLTEAVVVAKSSSSTVLAERIKSELDRIGRHGSFVRVEIIAPASLEPSSTRAVLTASQKPRAADANLLRQVESSVTRLLRLEASMHRARRELDSLCGSALRLEGALDTSFPDRAQRELVTENLRDAERLITLMLARTEAVQTPTAEFLTRLAVATGSPWRPVPLRPELESGADQRWARNARPAGASEAKASADSQPPSKTASSSEPATRADFEP